MLQVLVAYPRHKRDDLVTLNEFIHRVFRELSDAFSHELMVNVLQVDLAFLAHVEFTSEPDSFGRL